MSIIESLAHCGPSFSVKFHDKYVFAAYGPLLKVFEYKTKKLVSVCRIFRKNKIHGLSITESHKILAYGARSMAIFNIEDVMENSSLISKEKTCSEWIVSGEFSFDKTKVYFLTCYNKVLVFNLDDQTINTRAVFGERSILYSGSIKVYSDFKIYVVAGTVMNGIIIWDLLTEKLVHNLTGHEGSIFNVILSDNAKYIASCSDDRSIRIWNFETGAELAIGWGHTARIWDLKFYDNDSKLISVSEDCTCRVWSLLNNTGELEMTQENIYEVHQIKNVWSVDVQEDDMIAVTSGNDGRIKLIDLLPTSRYGNELQKFNLQDMYSKSQLTYTKGEIIKGFQLFKFGLITITSLGNIWRYTYADSKWKFLLKDDKFSSFSITTGFTSQNTVIFANSKGTVLGLVFSNDGETILHNINFTTDKLSKVINCLSCLDVTNEKATILLESPNPRDKLLVLKLDMNKFCIDEVISFDKPLNFTSSCIEVYKNLLIIGSRFSTVSIFNLDTPESHPYTIKNISPGDTITSILNVEHTEHSFTVSVTNRDGFYNFIKYYISDNDTIESHSIIHSNKVARGFLEGAFFDKDGDYIIYGFKSNLFYMYNESKCFEISSQLCGGAYRQWKFQEFDDHFMLPFIKSSELYLRKINKLEHPQTLNDSFHGREIRDITIQKYVKYNDGYLFCTASEDTTLRLSHFSPLNNELKTYWLQRKHVSGLQRCSFINDKFMISTSAREELFLWDIDVESKNRPYMALRQSLPVSSEVPDLRIMDFSVIFIEGTSDFVLVTVYSDSRINVWYYKNKENKFSILCEGRYQTCCILNVELTIFSEQIYCIITPTDGYVVAYNITEYIPFSVLNDGKTLNPIDVEITKANLPLYETKVRVHQSGIKSMYLHSLDNANQLNIFTTGDDNGVGMTIFKYDSSLGKIQGSVVDFNPTANTSTITSCVLMNNGTKLATTSVDQIVRIYDVTENILIPVDEMYTTIADTGSLDLIDESENSTIMFIGGVGFSALRWNNLK